jgi:hypothetical protein
MTEPQEHRSIDELFRNSFHNLPETPAETGWDTPSDKVWQGIQQNIQATPKTNRLKQVLLAGVALTVAIGLYVVFTPKPATVETKVPPVMETPSPDLETTAPAPAATEKSTPAAKETPAVSSRRAASPATHSGAQATPNRDVPVRSGGAAPLPGTRTDVNPNTTEELKAKQRSQQQTQEHQR